MSNSKTTTLLAINVYKFKGYEIAAFQTPKHYKFIEYCLREDNGKMDKTEFYHQFEDSTDDKEYYLFDLIGADDLLMEEISNSGIEDALKNYNFLELFGKLESNNYENYKRYIPITSYIVIDMIYSSCYTAECNDYDLDIKIIGYLNENKELIKL